MSIQSFASTVGMSNNKDQPYTKDVTAITINTGNLPYIVQHLQYNSYMIGLNSLDHNFSYLHCFVIIKVTTGNYHSCFIL